MSTPPEPHGAPHVAAGSWWPLTMAIGVALTLTGLVINRLMLVIGVVLSLVSLGLWVRDARRELRDLPE